MKSSVKSFLMEPPQTKQTYICRHCKKRQDNLGIRQTEVRYYALILETNQWEDFHGDERVLSQDYFCTDCQTKIDSKIANRLIK